MERTQTNDRRAVDGVTRFALEQVRKQVGGDSRIIVKVFDGDDTPKNAPGTPRFGAMYRKMFDRYPN